MLCKGLPAKTHTEPLKSPVAGFEPVNSEPRE
jgi:hypothetical protein